MKNKQRKTVTLLWGLPGSGKTYYKTENAPQNGYKPQTVSICADAIARSTYRPDWKSIDKLIAEDVVCKMTPVNVQEIIVDGLLTTNAAAEKWIEAILKEAGDDYIVSFKIVWWTPNKEACKHNDAGRRSESSVAQIENMPFEEPDATLVKKYKIGVTRKEVVRKADYRLWAALQGLGDQDTLESSTWCLGGTWGDYNGHTGTVSPSPQPLNFEEFDKLLEEICPNITFLQYKKLYGNCVEIRESSESSYYGGTTNYARYVCDLKKLYDGLKTLGIFLKGDVA